MPSVRLISHASVIIEAGPVRILTDPWLFGTCFDDSWGLIAPAADLAPYLDMIDYLWISHEHPDHFHIPSLKSLPRNFKERVTVLFQRSSDYPKMVKALHAFGFPNVKLLPHREWIDLGDAKVLCYQSRQLDSALAVRSASGTILNLNDCDFGPRDLALLKGDVGEVDLLLNQFSIAGFDGVERGLPAVAKGILDDMVTAHRALKAGTTIPFASFAYFCCPDNRFINAYANRPTRIAERFEREGLALAVLQPGQACVMGETTDSGPALAVYERLYDGIDDLPLVDHRAIGFAELAAAFETMRAKLRRQHGLSLKLLKPVTVAIEDLGMNVELGFAAGRFSPTGRPADLSISSQPLHFMLSNNFGLQSLGVSGRYRLIGNARTWMVHRVLFAMLNAGIGLSARRLASFDQLRFFWGRRHDIAQQALHSLARASRGTAA